MARGEALEVLRVHRRRQGGSSKLHRHCLSDGIICPTAAETHLIVVMLSLAAAASANSVAGEPIEKLEVVEYPVNGGRWLQAGQRPSVLILVLEHLLPLTVEMLSAGVGVQTIKIGNLRYVGGMLQCDLQVSPVALKEEEQGRRCARLPFLEQDSRRISHRPCASKGEIIGEVIVLAIKVVRREEVEKPIGELTLLL